MPDYTGGYTSALNDISSRNLQKTQQQTMLEAMTEKALTFQQQQQDKQDQTAAEAALVKSLPLLQTPQPDGPQPPPPGQSSQPMTPPPPGGAAPPPMAGPPGGAPPPPTAAMAPPGAQPPPGAMPPPPGAAMPPPGWKASPAAPPHLGGPPQGSAQPGPSSGMPSPAGGLPPPQAAAPPPPGAGGAPGAAPPQPGGAPPQPGGMPSGDPSGIQPPKIIDPFKMAATLMKSNPGMTPHQSALMLQQMWPMIDSQNKSAVDAYTRATKQAEDVVKYRQQLMKEDQEQHRVDQGDAKLAQGATGLEERSTHDRAMEKAAMIRANRTGGGTGGGAATTPFDKLPPEQQKKIDFYASQSLKGSNDWRTNQGRSPQGRALMSAVLDRLPDLAAEKGLTADDAAMAIAEFQGAKAGERTLGTRSATVGMASNEASSLADLALDASEKVSRTDVKSINDAVQKVQKGTASPELRAFTAANTSLINAYARAINPQGVGTVADKEHARDMLDTAFSKGDYASTVHQLLKEIAAAKKSPTSVKAEMREGFTGKKPSGSPPPTNGKGWQLMKDKNGNMAYVSPDRTQHEAVAAQ